MPISKVTAIKDFFGVPGKPVTLAELKELRATDKDGYDDIAEACAKALGETLTPAST